MIISRHTYNPLTLLTQQTPLSPLSPLSRLLSPLIASLPFPHLWWPNISTNTLILVGCQTQRPQHSTASRLPTSLEALRTLSLVGHCRPSPIACELVSIRSLVPLSFLSRLFNFLIYLYYFVTFYFLLNE